MLDPTVSLFTNAVLNIDEILTSHADTDVCCPVCGNAITAFTQPALLPWHTARLMVQCANAACVGATTLEAGDWLDLVLTACVKGAA